MIYKVAMVKGIAKASRSSGGDSVGDIIVAVVLGIGIGAVVLALTVASPISVIIDGTRLHAGKEMLGIGILGVIISNIWAIMQVSISLYERYLPMTDSKNYYTEKAETLPKRIAVVVGTIIVTLALIGLIVAATAALLHEDLSTAGTLAIVWGSVTIVMNVIAVVFRVLD